MYENKLSNWRAKEFVQLKTKGFQKFVKQGKGWIYLCMQMKQDSHKHTWCAVDMFRSKATWRGQNMPLYKTQSCNFRD